jgi:hypothetical protein
LAPIPRQRITDALAARQSVRVVILAGGADDYTQPKVQAGLHDLGLPADRVLVGGYPEAFLQQRAQGGAYRPPALPVFTPSAQPAPAEGLTLHERFFGAPAPLDDSAMRADLRAAAILYHPGVVLAPATTNPDPLAALAGQLALYGARKAGVPLQALGEK